ncbi:MAG: phospho-sugar mutase [Bacteroidales bacterium]|nr:phospho-sugar mutase [Bacteroidales bacterium]
MDPNILERVRVWLDGNYDEQTKAGVRDMVENDQVELTDSFYRDLEFGTGGLRGIMGIGTNRMNKYTVGMATQGLANYLKKMFPDQGLVKVAIAYDSRNNNTFFAQVAADVLTANGIKVYVFDELKPTPELSYTIRELGCHSGLVITASHNPKEYNGYKVYWKDGGQVIAPHDKNIIDEVNAITSVEDVKFEGNPVLYETIGEEIDKKYIEKVRQLTLSPELVEKHKNLKIVYTPIHGTGVKLVPQSLDAYGFKSVYNVPEQDVIDGNFPTVHSPNPEESAALNMAIEKAKAVNASLVLATDPDADRVGVAVRKQDGEFVLLNGNQTASLMIYYLLSKWQEKGKIKGKEYICKTIVTTELLKKIADKFNVPTYDVLTGFKYIADVIKKYEGTKEFIGGGEESYGYLVGEFVRDKDAVISCCMIAETAVWAAEKGKTLYELLPEIYTEFGFYKEKLISVTRKGKAGAEEIQAMMADFRANPKPSLAGARMTMVKDYQSSISKDLLSGKEENIDLPKSNVIQFFTEDGDKITVRPSGTEPKIKFYFSVKAELNSVEDYSKVDNLLEQKIDQIVKELDL